ncbi:MAG: chloride channel protein [Phycisphaeraceae bacterium]
MPPLLTRPFHTFVEIQLPQFRRRLLPIIAVGVAGGLAGLAYLSALQLAEHWLGPQRWAMWPHLAVMAVVGLLVGLLTRYVGNPGDVELLVNNIHVLGGQRNLRELRSLVPVSLLCIGAGGAMGPEAPLVQTTGALGSWLANRLGMVVHDKRVLTITGMAAGFTVLFGAPLGAAVFALEILHRRGLQYYEALLPAVIGSLCGYVVFVVAWGLGLAPVWQFPDAPALRSIDLAWALAAGAAGAAVAVLFTYFNLLLRRMQTRVPGMVRPIVGGVILGLLAFWSPYALTFGEAQINDLLSHPMLAPALLTAAAAKFIGTSVTLSTGWRGGFIIPLFFVGAALGGWADKLWPAMNSVVVIAALMVAINTGVTKTPLGSTLVVTEMAGLHLLPTTLLAAVVALLLTSEVGLIHSQRERDPLPSLPTVEANAVDDRTGGHPD